MVGETISSVALLTALTVTFRLALVKLSGSPLRGAACVSRAMDACMRRTTCGSNWSRPPKLPVTVSVLLALLAAALPLAELVRSGLAGTELLMMDEMNAATYEVEATRLRP